MAEVQIAAKTGDSKPVSVGFDFGDSDDAMLAKFSPKIVCSYARAAMKVALQDVIRSGITGKKPTSEIAKDVAGHKFDEKKRGKSKAEKLASQFDSLDPEEKKRLLASLQK